MDFVLSQMATPSYSGEFSVRTSLGAVNGPRPRFLFCPDLQFYMCLLKMFSFIFFLSSCWMFVVMLSVVAPWNF